MTNVSFRRRLLSLAIVIVSALGLSHCQSLRAQVAAPPQPAEEQQGATTPAAELKMVAAIACTNYDHLTGDIDFIGSLIGQPNVSQGLEMQLNAMTGGKGLTGVDKAKPWGLILQTDGTQFLPIVCLPVTNEDDVTAAIAAVGAEIKDGPDGTKELALPNGSVFMKTAGGWSFLSKNQASLARLPKNPETAFATLLKNYDIAARAAVQNVPPFYRQMAVLTLQAAMQKQAMRQPQESDEEFTARRKALDAQMQQTVQQVQELDTLTLGVQVDASKKMADLEFTYTVVPDGTLAKQFAAYGEPKTNFAGFQQADAAVTFGLVAKADPQAIQNYLAQFETMVSGAKTQFNKGVDENGDALDPAKREAIKAAAAEWFDALAATMKAGQFDGIGSLQVTPSSLDFVAARWCRTRRKWRVDSRSWTRNSRVPELSKA